MENLSPSANEKAGTIGGTLLVVLVQITTGELVKTAVMAAVGAVVSFAVSWVLQRWVKRKGSSL
ncbi:MAG TPA: hypothetical protein VGE06_04250 [Flavisolibacter sp.]